MTTITSEGRQGRYLSEMWRFRELCYFLFYRDFLIRYRQTLLGVLWALVRPVLSMVVLTLIFDRIAGLSSPGGIPYPLLVYAALLPWQLFSSSLLTTSSSLISNGPLVSKVYFPKLILPLGKLFIGIADAMVALVPMIGLMLYYGIYPSALILLFPFVLLATALFVAGIGSFLAAVNIRYRDVRFAVPFFLQLAFYLSPVGYSTAMIPLEFRPLYCLNPMVVFAEASRTAFLGYSHVLSPVCYLVSFGVTILVFTGGTVYFCSKERHFADLI